MNTPNKQTDLSKIKMLVMDVDGVLTDGGIIINADGSESKRFSAYDGHRIKMWQRAGLACAIISGRNTPATEIRARQLNIQYVMQDCKQKLPALKALVEKTGTAHEYIAYIGDDLVDLPVIIRVGFGAATANAASEVKKYADYVTSRSGGQGAVGEVIEYIFSAAGKWSELIERYLL